MRKFIEDFEQHKIIQLNKTKNNYIITFIKFKQIIILYTKTLLLLYTVKIVNKNDIINGERNKKAYPNNSCQE